MYAAAQCPDWSEILVSMREDAFLCIVTLYYNANVAFLLSVAFWEKSEVGIGFLKELTKPLYASIQDSQKS